MWARLKAKASKLLPWLSQLVAIVLIGLVFFLGVRSERTGFVREVIDPGFRKLRDPVLNAFRAKPPEVNVLRIQLDPANFDSLMALSDKALNTRSVPVDGNAVLMATIHIGEREVPVVLGLREGTAIPGAYTTWPLYVRTLPGDTVLGMQTFDMLPIVNEAPLWSILLHAVLRSAGHASLQSAVAEVELNERSLGLYVLQGRPDHTMLARWSRGNGPVLRFDDALLMDARAMMEERTFPSSTIGQGDWMAAPLLLQSVEGDVLSGRAQKAIKRMEAFRSGLLDPSQVFNTDQVARLLAISELLGTRSALDWWNLRFLVDSISEELVPIPLHITQRAPITALMAAEQVGNEDRAGREIVDRFLADPEIMKAYIACLDTISAPGWWERELDLTKPEWEPARIILNSEFPKIDLDTEVLEHDRTVIHQTLNPKSAVLAYVRDAQHTGDGIAVSNVHALPVDVLGVIWSSGDTVLSRIPLQLPPRPRDRPLKYATIPIRELDQTNTPVELLVRIGGMSPRSEPIRTWSSFGAN